MEEEGGEASVRFKAAGGVTEPAAGGTGGEGSGGEAAVSRDGVCCASPAVAAAPGKGTSGVDRAMGAAAPARSAKPRKGEWAGEARAGGEYFDCTLYFSCILGKN